MSGLRSVTLDLPSDWSRAPAARARTEAPAGARRFRLEVGLDADRPVVLSGHQSEVWHAGILAKRMALAAILERDQGVRAAWVVVDQDANEPGDVRYVARDAEGVLVERTWSLAPSGAGADVAGACRPPIERVPPLPTDAATPEIRDSLGRVARAIEAEPHANSLAHQVACAAESLASCGGARVPLVLATAIGRTSLFRWVVERMHEDAPACVAAYNRAAAAHPDADVRALEPDELPIWRLEQGRARARVRAGDRSEGPLAPRALLMTGLLRWAGCDLFIHGLGGASYDRVTREWLGAWLGATLAPAGVASATCVLDSIPEVPPTARQAADARARARRARTDPSIIGDEADAERRAILAAIERSKRERRGDETRSHFARLHALLEDYARRRDDDLRALDLEAARLDRRAAGTSILGDRTWPFVLHADATLQDLRSAVGQAIG